MTIGEIVTSVVSRIILIFVFLGLLYTWGPDILNYFIDRYDEWEYTFNRITRRRNK